MRNKSKELLDQVEKNNRVDKEFMHIFLILTRLRQICDHPKIVFNDWETMMNDGQADLEKRIK